MVDLVAHCLPPATIADADGATWVWESPFLVTPVLSNGFSSAIGLASCEGDLDVPVSLCQWVSLLGILVSGPDTPDRPWEPLSLSVGSANDLGWVWLCPLSNRIGNLRSWKLVEVPVLIFLCSLAIPGPGRELPRSVYAGDKFGGIWLGPTSRLGTGGSLYPFVMQETWPLWPLPWTAWGLWSGRMVVLWIGMNCPVHEKACTSLNGFGWIYGSMRP